MPSDLDELLAAISPERTLDHVSAGVDEAVNSFERRAVGTERWDWEDFEEYMGRFFQHVYHVACRLRAPMDDPHGFFYANAHVLEQEYGPQWRRLVLQLVRTGAEGGLHRMLRASAERLAEHWTRNRIGSLVSEYWTSLSDREREQVPGEYLSKCGALLPPEVRRRLSYEPWFNFCKVLERHPHLVDRVRRLL